jgi:hypothetical protein
MSARGFERAVKKVQSEMFKIHFPMKWKSTNFDGITNVVIHAAEEPANAIKRMKKTTRIKITRKKVRK